ncbi:unnamed protein product [Ceutorhynchus assimilis]|uniref:Uncharacterized protein n=1 Tax=Ceutorhynchus assimilis TaxID=467358 RepID=A0A9N9MD59_9CUCU|nr:unnamed protein product [Ceutorhynchus assimilis]
MAENTRESYDQSRNIDGHPLHFSSLSIEHDADKEARLRTFKERQNEERQKKLEEIKAQALAAQRFKEQKEQERRRRLDEMRIKDDSRRHQVEERKRAINDAERDRLESIIRRNQEREARIETRKRHERSNIVFAFGSSTPRMLDNTDASLSYWGQRRATSIQNITSTATPSNLTRRQSERDLDAASKKRATSAGGSDRPESLTSPTIPAGCASGYLGRRRTDLVPTIPSRDSSFHSSASRKSLNHSPGRAYSMSRLDQLAKPRKPLLPALNESNMSPKSSMTRSMGHLAHVGSAKLSPRKPLNKIDSRSMHHLSPDGPVAPPRVNRATQLRKERLLAQQSGSTSEASSRPSSSMSQQSTNSVTSSVNVRHRISNAPRRPRPASIAVTGVTNEIRNSFDREHKPPLPKTRKPLSKTNTSEKIEKAKRPLKSPAEETAPKIVGEDKKVRKEIKEKKEIEEVIKLPIENGHKEPEKEVEPVEPVQAKEPTPQLLVDLKEEPVHDVQEEAHKPHIPKLDETQPQQNEATKSEGNLIQNFINNERNLSADASHESSESVAHSQTTTTIMTTSVTETKELKPENGESNEMTSSMSKPRINTEEEAKAALAERRRLMREETERQAELERQRIEAEQKAEFEKQQKEEEQARLLAEMQRKAEQERLQEAIKEVQKREEEDRLRKEEELRQKVLKEEADKKAKEEAERQKAELQKKLENEEKEREERRKRVEMIMSRTRGKANANLASQQNSQDRNENTSDSKQQVNDIEFNEDNQVNENKLNGTKKENGTNDSSATQNGKGVDSGIDNIIPDQSVNANTVADTINTDSLNSNSAWQTSSQQYGNLICNNNS